MNKTIRTMSSNNKVIKLMVIFGLFTLLLSGCQQVADVAKNATNTATTANTAPTNTAANNAATNTAANSEVAKTTTASDANTNPVAPPKPDNCNGPADNEVIVYEDVFWANGGGKCVKLKVGEFKNAAEMGFPDNQMSAIKVGVNVKATICDGENFAAPCEEFEKTDFDLMNNPTIKNDTATSLKVVEIKAETKPEAKPEAIKAFTNTVVGEWVSNVSTKLIFAEDKFDETGSGGQRINSTPYKVVDGKTIEYNDTSGKANKAVITFEDNGNSLVWYRPDTGGTFKLKRVTPK